MVALRGQVGPQPAATSFRHSGPGGRAAFSWLAVAHASVVSDLAHQSHRCGHSRAPLGGRPEAGRAAYRRLWKKRSLLQQRSAAALLWYGVTRAHPDMNQGPADLQSAALTTELCTQWRPDINSAYTVVFRWQRKRACILAALGDAHGRATGASRAAASSD